MINRRGKSREWRSVINPLSGKATNLIVSEEDQSRVKGLRER
jgi:hypothetical protein